MIRSFVKITCLCAALISASAAMAEEPTDVLKRAVGKLKETGDPVTLIDFVDWKTALSQVDEAQKKEFKIETPADLKAFYTRALADPASMMKEHFQKQMATSTPEQQETLKQSLVALERSLKEQMDAVRTQIKNTEYTVGKSEIKGDHASVDLTTKFEGEERTDQVEFVKAEGKWLLASLDDIEGAEEAPALEDEELIEEEIAEEDEEPMTRLPEELTKGAGAPPAPIPAGK